MSEYASAFDMPRRSRVLRKMLQPHRGMLGGGLTRLVLVPALLLAGVHGCASQRAAVEPESAIQRQLGFIRGGDATRSYVEARLGAPVSVYESGRVVSYALHWHDDRFMLDAIPGSECYGLVIVYGADERIARHALIRMGSNRCRR
jgi:hypothetical protein